MNKHKSQPTVFYTAAGGVVIHQQKVLVLNRPVKNEVRLPKGHIESGEDAVQTALREVAEESGYVHLQVVKDLGIQIVEFDYQGTHVIRTEHYFLMTLVNDETLAGETQFEPIWLSASEALVRLTYAAEREWMCRAYENMV